MKAGICHRVKQTRTMLSSLQSDAAYIQELTSFLVIVGADVFSLSQSSL